MGRVADTADGRSAATLGAYRRDLEATMHRSVQPSRKAQLLASLPLFEECPAQDLAVIGALFDEITAEPGTVLVREGTPGLECFFVVSGTARATLRGDTRGDPKSTR